MSGYRCPEHNKAVGGAKGSMHMLGIASDIIIAGVAPSAVQEYLLEKYRGKYGIGRYSYFTHVDVRAKKGGARWG